MSTSATHQDVSAALRAYSRKRWPLAADKFRKERLAQLLNISSRRVRSLWQAEATAALDNEDEISRIERLTGVCLRGGQNGGAGHDTDFEDEPLAERLASLEAQVAFLISALGGGEVGRESQDRG